MTQLGNTLAMLLGGKAMTTLGVVMIVLITMIAFVQADRTSRGSSKSSSKSDGSSKSKSGKKGAVSYFLLQDTKDGMCLLDGGYKRCGSDTLWYVTGPSGSYNLHKGDPKDPKAAENICLARTECVAPRTIKDDHVEVELKSCMDCGVPKWDILGDATQGYVLVQDGINCVNRGTSNSSYLSHCDNGYATFNLHFISTADIATMNSEGAKMILAAEENNKEEVVSLLNNKDKGGIDVNSLDWNDRTSLIGAAAKGHEDMVHYLLEERLADVNLSDKDGMTALMEAATGGFMGIVKLLVEQGADVEAVANTGVSALWLAADSGHDEVVAFLLRDQHVGAEVQRADGVSALQVASTEGHNEVVKLLLEAGANVESSDRDGITPLISAAEKGHEGVVEMLLKEKASLDVFSVTEFSPLILASAHGHEGVARQLLKAGASVDLANADNVTAIMYAASGGHKKVVDLLIKSKAKVNDIHSHGGSALFEAATNGSVEVVDALLSAGADAFVKDIDGVTTLMTATSQGHTEVAAALVKKGVAVNEIAASGGTALMFAAVGGYSDTVDFLLKNKADVTLQVQATPEYLLKVQKELAEGKEDAEPHKNGLNALMLAAQNGHLRVAQAIAGVAKNSGTIATIMGHRDVDGLSALAHAVKGKHLDMAQFLLELEGADPDDSYVDEASGKEVNFLLTAVAEENEPFALQLIDKGCKVNVADSGNNITALTQAAYLGQTSVVKALLGRDVDAHAKNSAGTGPLMAAAAEGYVDITRSLLQEAGVHPDDPDEDDTTPLMVSSVRGHKDIVIMLLGAGADVNARNTDGHTALMFAYNGRTQVRSLQQSYKDLVEVDVPGQAEALGAALEDHTGIIGALLKGGADPELIDRENHRASDFDTIM